jgi:hypothetical protein
MPKLLTILISVVVVGAMVTVGWLAAVGTTKSVPDMNAPVARSSYSGGTTGGGGGGMSPDAPEPEALPQDYITFNITTRVGLIGYYGVPPVEPEDGWDYAGEFNVIDLEIHQFVNVGDGVVETTQKLNLLAKGHAGLITIADIFLTLQISGPHGYLVNYQQWQNNTYFITDYEDVSMNWATGRLFIFESGQYTLDAALGIVPYTTLYVQEPPRILASKEIAFTIP